MLFHYDSPESVGRSSPPSPVEQSSEIPENPSEDVLPSLEETPAEPTQPAADPDPVPNDQFPEEPDSTGLTGSDPDPVTTLAERLGDVGAYQYNGQKGLDLLESLSAQEGWATPGQTLPSKADPLELLYQLGAECLNTAPVSGLLMAVVNPDQTFARGPEVVGSTGYAILDEQAIAMDDQDPETWYSRGNALAHLTRYDDAVESYDRAIALKPDHDRAKRNRDVVCNQLVISS